MTYNRFVEVMNMHQMIQENDTVALEVSSNQHAVMLLECFMKLKKENRELNLEFFVMENEGELTKGTQELLTKYNIHNYHMLSSEAMETMYESVKQAGCNVIALPDTHEDIVTMTIMSMMQQKKVTQIQPKKRVEACDGMTVIRPLCFMNEALGEGNTTVSFFKQLSYVEEGLQQQNQAIRYEFSVYETA